MKVRYIAIEREYGSGGTKIAEETAELCGIPCYGHEILESVAEKLKRSVDELSDYEESRSNSLLYSLYVMTQSQTGNPDLLSSEEKLFIAETQKIKELGKRGPAIFVGHCAGYALREEEGVLNVFIHADDAFKYRRVTEDYGIPGDKADATCRKFNKKRAGYYEFSTRKKWNDPRNYDIVLDSSRLGISGCAAALSAVYLKSLEQGAGSD